MEKLCLNGYGMNEVITILKEASIKSEKSNFTIKCNNCTLSIVCGGIFNWDEEAVEVALFVEDGIAWHSLDMKNSDGSIFTLEKPIISSLPLVCVPAFIKQFKTLSDDDMPVVWDAWDTISFHLKAN